MAPTVAIETIVIVRPLKVVAVMCGCVALFLMMLSIAATTWLEADGRREGLWEICRRTDKDDLDIECQKNQPRAWIEACRVLCLSAVAVCLCSVIVACVGLNTERFRWKYHYYKAAMIIMFVAVALQAISLIIFPVKFLEEIGDRAEVRWEFGWAYGIGWGSAIFMLGSSILLLIDRDNEEVLYREKTHLNNFEAEDV
ncbi:hypothetical protein LOTGIDRAFT_182635 [Lottia gigantea]|uniref:Transmembrane protein 47 n=1 Tax=Lottia gigantea TaxID=225164 RepID=V4ADI7_LOTGI|nr:hypothetical protein LOTGIDRAFT_182635 [Lottia gigantea]ESO91371.1 hypothetical protein LOTGIDRAFT_182635 [Lottia gigantea]